MKNILNTEDIIGINKLISELQQSGADDSILDEAVQDAKSAEASEINNGGFGDQVIYLVRCYGVDDAREIIAGALPGKGEDLWGYGEEEDDRLSEARYALGQYMEPGQHAEYGQWIEDEEKNEFFIGVKMGKPGFTHMFTVEFEPGTTRVIHIDMRKI